MADDPLDTLTVATYCDTCNRELINLGHPKIAPATCTACRDWTGYDWGDDDR